MFLFDLFQLDADLTVCVFEGNDLNRGDLLVVKIVHKSDLTKGFRAIIYTRGGKHVVLTSAPMCMLSRAKKYNKELDVKITGAKDLLSY